MGNFDDTIECYDDILKKYIKQGEAYFEQANLLYFDKNEIKAAIVLYNKAISLGTRNENIYYNLGMCLEASGDMEQALKWIERAIHINQQRIDFLLKKASILTLLNKLNGAKETYDMVLTMDFKNEEAYHFKSILLARQEKYDEAFSVLIDAEEIIGEKVIFKYDKALIFEAQMKFKDALEAIEQALVMVGDNKLLLEKQAFLLLLLEKGDDAKMICQKITQLDPENMEGYFNKASVCLLNQELNESLTIFESIIKKSAKDNAYKIYSYYFRALVLSRLGKDDEASEAYKYALQNYNILLLDYPYDVQLQLLKANSLRDTRRYKEAEEIYEYVIDLNKTKPEAYLNRAKNFTLLGKVDRAKEAIEATLKLNYKYKEIIEMDKDLKLCLN